MDYISVALKIWPLIERLIALNKDRADSGLPPLTEAQARIALQSDADALSAKIQADLDAH